MKPTQAARPWLVAYTMRQGVAPVSITAQCGHVSSSTSSAKNGARVPRAAPAPTARVAVNLEVALHAAQSRCRLTQQQVCADRLW